MQISCANLRVPGLLKNDSGTVRALGQLLSHFTVSSNAVTVVCLVNVVTGQKRMVSSTGLIPLLWYQSKASATDSASSSCQSISYLRFFKEMLSDATPIVREQFRECPRATTAQAGS
jgi:hypothetical protein